LFFLQLYTAISVEAAVDGNDNTGYEAACLVACQPQKGAEEVGNLTELLLGSAREDLGGIKVSGAVLAEALVGSGVPGRPVALVKYSLPFEKVTSEKTTQVWPKRLRSKVFEIQKTRAGKLKNPLSKERQEELLAEYTQKGEEDAGFGL